MTPVSPLVSILPPHLTYHSTGQNLAALHANQGLESLLVALDRSLASGSLAESLRTHDDLQGELTELVLGVYSLAPASTALAQAARRVLMALIVVAGGPGGNPIVLRALLPLLTMKAGRNGLPSDARARTSAHQKAVAVLRTLIEKGEEQKRAHVRKCGMAEDSQEDGDATAPGEGGGGMDVEVTGALVDQEVATRTRTETEVAGDREGKEGPRKEKGKRRSKKGGRGDLAKGDGEDANSAEGTQATQEKAESSDGAVDAGQGKSKGKRRTVPADLHTTVLAVLEHMCADAPDRADVRARLVVSVLSLLEALQRVAPALGPRFIVFLARLLRSTKVANRAFGVEIAASFVNATWAWPSATVTASGGNAAAEIGSEQIKVGGAKEAATDAEAVKAMWASLVELVQSFASRVVDKAPTVRARAMVCLSEMLLSVQEDVAPPGLRKAILALAFPEPRQGQRESSTATTAQHAEKAAADPSTQDLVCLVRSRCQDDKAVVRKAALQALEILLTTGRKRGRGEVPCSDVALFATRCNDVSVLTRKQAMASLSSLLLADPGNGTLQKTWVKAVLPLVADPEQSILNRLVELIHEVILDRIIEWHRQRQEIASGVPRSRSGREARPRRGKAGTGDDDGEETEEERKTKENAAIWEHAAIHARTSTVWELLSIVASRDLNKCLQNAIRLVVQAQNAQAVAPRRLKELMDALQSAALASIVSAAPESNSAEKSENPTALRRGAWALLEAILASDHGGSFQPSVGNDNRPSGPKKVLPSEPSFVVTCWRRAFEGLGGEKSESDALEEDARKILRVLARIASDVPVDLGTGLAEELLGYLSSLHPRLSPENCGAALETITALHLAKARTSAEGAAVIRKAALDVLEACEKALQCFVVAPGEEPRTQEGGSQDSMSEVTSRLERATFLVGAVAILGFSPNEEEVKNTAALSQAEKGKKKKKSDTPAPGSPGGGPLIRIPIPAATTALIRLLLLPEILPLNDTKKGGEERSVEATVSADRVPVQIPNSVRAHAFLALGKICLRDKALAKENVNVFVRELSLSSSAAIKSNALLILGDLCVRYTSMVERHVPAMARCLQDESSLIRRHALALISQLLLQDYLKWRGLLLHRYLAILVDEDTRVAEVADYMIFSPLLRKNPSLFVNHFVEALVVLNGCSDHDAYKAALAQGAESGTAVTMEGVDLEGSGPAANKRMRIYQAMLQHMSDEQRIQVTAKLTQDILGAATDEDGEAGGIKIQSYHRASRFTQGLRREAALRKLKRDENLIRDALTVLQCPDIKVAGGRGFGGGGEGGAGASGQDEDAEALMAEDGSGNGVDAAAAAKSRLLSKVSRKHLLEHVVPELVSLKACLERAHSPLIRNVMEYFLELMRHSKEEVKDALSTNPTLFHEIEFDLQQFEKELKAQAEAQAAMPPPTHPPKSPGESMGRQSTGSNLSRNVGDSQGRQSSLGSVMGRTPLQARTSNEFSSGSNSERAGSRLSGCSAPPLRRSSMGMNMSRTPSEAIKAALQPGSGTASQSLTPVLASAGKRRGVGSDSGGRAGEEMEEGMHVNVQLPTAIKEWNVTVGRSPLDSKENMKDNVDLEMQDI